MGWTQSPLFNTGSAWDRMAVKHHNEEAREGTAMYVRTVGIDLAKNLFHVHRCLTASKPITPRDRFSNSGQHIIQTKHLEQTQDLNELPLAGLAHARLEQAAQHRELFGQFPA